jgi:hypothetical protein
VLSSFAGDVAAMASVMLRYSYGRNTSMALDTADLLIEDAVSRRLAELEGRIGN